MGCSASEIKGQPKPKVEPEPKGHAIEKTIDNEPIKPKPAIKPKYPKNTLDKYSSSGEDEDSVIEKSNIIYKRLEKYNKIYKNIIYF